MRAVSSFETLTKRRPSASSAREYATGRVRRRSKDLTAEGVSVARTLRRCSEGSLRSSFESDTSELAPPNSSEGGGRDEEMGV